MLGDAVGARAVRGRQLAARPNRRTVTTIADVACEAAVMSGVICHRWIRSHRARRTADGGRRKADVGSPKAEPRWLAMRATDQRERDARWLATRVTDESANVVLAPRARVSPSRSPCARTAPGASPSVQHTPSPVARAGSRPRATARAPVTVPARRPRWARAPRAPPEGEELFKNRNQEKGIQS